MYSTACSRTVLRAQAVLNCGALRGAAKSHVLAVRIALLRVWRLQWLHAVLITGSGTDETLITTPFEERSRRRGHKPEVRARCVVQIGAESGPCPLPRLRPCGGVAARRSMDVMGERMRGRVRQGLGGQETSWIAYGGQKRACALHRAEYVKSKDPVNASHWSQDWCYSGGS